MVLHNAVNVGTVVDKGTRLEVKRAATLYGFHQRVLDKEFTLGGVLVLAENIIVIKKFFGLRHSTGFLDGYRKGSRES
jgi:hypothetical protein